MILKLSGLLTRYNCLFLIAWFKKNTLENFTEHVDTGSISDLTKTFYKNINIAAFADHLHQVPLAGRNEGIRSVTV